jgi:hypothetical protein
MDGTSGVTQCPIPPSTHRLPFRSRSLSDHSQTLVSPIRSLLPRLEPIGIIHTIWVSTLTDFADLLLCTTQIHHGKGKLQKNT